jgi:hypothetical protein
VPGSHPSARPHRQPRTEPLSLGPAAPAPPAPPAAAATGTGAEPRACEEAVAYGPDDPAYGPPTADWYQRADEARQREVQEELPQSRGPFEPLPPDHEVTEPPPPSSFPAGAQPADTSQADDQDDQEDDLDVALVGQGTGPLARIKDLYATAESIGERRLDRHFEQLLERQRQLIGDYFAKQHIRGPAGPRRAPANRPAAPGAAASTGVAGPENGHLSGPRRSHR